MCRYAFKIYKPHYVCFDCRKVFKQPTVEDMIVQNGDWDSYREAFLNKNEEKSKTFWVKNPKLIERFQKKYREKEYKCPQCREEMFNIGLDFKAPKKDKVKEWEIIRSMYRLGRTFHSCGCDGPGYIPENHDDYLKLLNEIQSSYKVRLADRSIKRSELELSQYIDYWNMKLASVEREKEILLDKLS